MDDRGTRTPENGTGVIGSPAMLPAPIRAFVEATNSGDSDAFVAAFAADASATGSSPSSSSPDS